MLFLLAYTFGKTSPNSKIKNVTITTSIPNFKMGEETAANQFFPTNKNKITTPILIKLLATRSVASNFLGFSSSFVIIFPFDGCSCKVSSKSFCDKENSATSAPEIRAEQNNKAKIATKPKTKLVSKV